MKFWRKLSGLFSRRRFEREMSAEMQAHLEGLVERNVAKGMSAEEARYAAWRAFGGVEQIKERAREERAFVWLEQFGQDLHYAARALRRAPAFTLTALLTLAFGIGVNAALFTLYNSIALKSLPVKEPERLVRIAGRTAKGEVNGGFSYAEYAAYRDGTHALEGLLAYTERQWTFQREGEGPAEPELEGGGLNTVTVVMVSENYFEVLGEVVRFGRGFQPDEFRTGAPVIVLSHLFWSSRLQSDPRVIGTSLRFEGRLYTVIGVAPAGFSGERAVTPAGWLPYSQWSPRLADYAATGPRAFALIGRLKPGVNLVQAKTDLDAIAAKWAADFPEEERAKTAVALRAGLPFAEMELNPKGLVALGTLFFGFALVLVIACTNVANLLFARGVSRQKEIGVRLALGASRGRIIRQLLTENALLCAGGAVVGLGLGAWTLQLLLTKVVAPHLPAGLPVELNLLPDLRVLGFTAVLTVGATLVAGLLPALHTSRASFSAALHAEGAAFGRRLTPARLRQLLLIVQVAVCLMLLSCAGVLVRNVLNLKITERGFDARAVHGAGLTPNAAIADRSVAWRQALATVQAIPGVAGCGGVNPMPFEDPYGLRVRIQSVGTAAGGGEQEAHTVFITGGFFDALGVTLRRGRSFREIEQQSSARVIIVSESLARQLWPGQEAVGKTLAVNTALWHRGARMQPGEPGTFRDCEVIGVAPDVTIQMGDGAQRAVFYQPLAFDAPVYAAVLVRPALNAAGARREIAQAAKAAGVGLQFGPPLAAKVDQLEMIFSGFALLGGALGALALTMASVGLYGLMTFAVNQRVREIGVRMALGATAGNVVRLFVRQSMRLVGIGLVLGLAGAGLFALFLEKALFGFKGAFDPVAFGGVTLLFGAIALFACWLPARRAAKVDPMIALRAE